MLALSSFDLHWVNDRQIETANKDSIIFFTFLSLNTCRAQPLITYYTTIKNQSKCPF